MIDSAVLIGAAIIAITQGVKYVAPKISGALTIVLAVLVGILVALLDTHIGVADISVAQGIIVALAAVGVHTTVTNPRTPSA